MASADDDPFGLMPVKKKPVHEIGQPLDTLSAGELDERIEALKEEIARLASARDSKLASKRAADAFFKS